MAVNIVPLRPFQAPDLGWLQSRRVEEELDRLRASRAGPMFAEDNGSTDRMAILARLLGDMEGNAVSREQLAQQGRQFEETLKATNTRAGEELAEQRRQFDATRALDERRVATVEEQLAEARAASARETKASQVATLLELTGGEVQAALYGIDAAAELSTSEVRDKADAMRRDMEQSMQGDFAPFAREVQLVAGQVTDRASADKHLKSVEDQVAGFERAFRSRMDDEGLAPHLRVAAITGAVNFTEPIMESLAALKASGADATRVAKLEETLLSMARDASRATPVVQALERAMDIDPTLKAAAREASQRKMQLAQEAQRFRRGVVESAGNDRPLPAGLSVGQFTGPMTTLPGMAPGPVSGAQFDMSGVEKALASLRTHPAPTTSGIPLGGPAIVGPPALGDQLSAERQTQIADLTRRVAEKKAREAAEAVSRQSMGEAERRRREEEERLRDLANELEPAIIPYTGGYGF